MNALKETAQALSANQSGHWGIVADVTSKLVGLEAAAFRVLKGGRQVCCLPLQCGIDGMLRDVDSGEVVSSDGLYDEMKRLVVQARKDKCSVARCIVTHFENLPLESQCSILRGSRAVRDETCDFIVQTVVSGAWNFFAIQQYWKQKYNNVSPVPDRMHVFFQGRLTGSDIIGKLRGARLVTNDPGRFAEVCADVLVEATGGDAFMLDWVMRALISQHLPLEALETVLSQAAESSEIVDEVARRSKGLEAMAWESLEAILSRQFVNRSSHDIHAEALRLQGFVASRGGGNLNTLSVRSPLLDRVLRNNWTIVAKERGPIVDGRDLARPNLALNTAAYRLVAQIEDTLRNLIVLGLGGGSDWSEPLKNVKTLAHEEDVVSTELLGLARVIQDTLGPRTEDTEATASQPKASSKPVTEPGPLESSKKPKQLSIVQAAHEWRQRNRQTTALELSGDSLIYFFTSEGLSGVLVNEKQDIYRTIVKRVYPNKHELIAFLEGYVAIRAAVAHNQPVTLRTLHRLEEMRCDLEKRISQAEDVLTQKA